MKFDFFLLQHICWLHDIAWIFFGLFFIKNAFYECLRFVFSQECMLKCMKFVWIWIFDFVIFEECLYKCMNFDFFFSFISRIYECRKFWNLIFSLNENACLKAWNLIGVLFEEYRMYEFDLEWKYIYFSKRYFFNTYSKSMYKWLTFIQKVCTKDFFLWFFPFMYKYFKNMYKLQSENICHSFLFSRFQCVESKVLSNHWIH